MIREDHHWPNDVIDADDPHLAPYDDGGPVRSCRECGCTDFEACSPPCWWVEADLCSSCAVMWGPHPGDDG